MRFECYCRDAVASSGLRTRVVRPVYRCIDAILLIETACGSKVLFLGRNRELSIPDVCIKNVSMRSSCLLLVGQL